MKRFEVWAPRADRVELWAQGRVSAMAATGGGWWSLVLDDLPPECDYAFVLDGEAPRPDPRSPRQPYGVHGPSRTIDHARFPWTDRGWNAPPLSSGVIHEVHVGTFSEEGTFDGAIAHLDHLVALGVTHVELMPVAAFPGARGWGYDGVSLFAPHEDYGGPDGLKRLVDACHERGLAVLLDVVYNHLGPDGNHLPRFGPYFTDRYETPWGDAPNLDGPGSDTVRRFFFDNARSWLRDYHLDGLRIDAVHSIVDTSALHFLEELAREVAGLQTELGRHLVLIAENDRNDPRVVRSADAGGHGFDAQWNEDFHHAMHALLTGEREGYYADFGTTEDLGATLERVYCLDGRFSCFRGRRHGRRAGDVPRNRFVACAQNHDQVGNRARGERLGHLVGLDDCRIAAALLLTAPFVPLLFQGEEWGASSPFQYFTDHQDEELAEAVRTGRRAEFGAFGWDPEQVPDPQDVATYERSKLDWRELDRERHRTLLEWYVALIRLRRTTPALLDGDAQATRVRADADWIVVRRPPITVVCNLGDGEREIPVEGAAAAHVVLRWARSVELADDSVLLGARAVAILSDEDTAIDLPPRVSLP